MILLRLALGLLCVQLVELLPWSDIEERRQTHRPSDAIHVASTHLLLSHPQLCNDLHSSKQTQQPRYTPRKACVRVDLLNLSVRV